MPPGQGTGKKMGGSIARQRSRNTTPSSSSVAAAAAAATSTPNIGSSARSATPVLTATLPDTISHKLKLIDNETVDLLLLERDLSYDDLVDAGCGTGSNLPDYRSVDGIIERLKTLQTTTESNGRNFDRGMRLLSKLRRTRMDQAAQDRTREEERLQRELADGENGAHGQHTTSSQKRANKKKRKAPTDGDGSQSKADAMEVDDKAKAGDENGKDSKKKGAAAEEEESEDSESSEDEGAPPPRPVPQHQTFGEDPSTFPDPTVYEIREVTPGMSIDEIKEIYSVSTFPKSDLADLIAGNPPDKDFSSAKPSNQINFSTFSTYIEPYFRAFTEEDLAFLRERGNRVSPFSIPKRGTRHYTEIWAEEDGAMSIDSSPPAGGSGDTKHAPNRPRGNIDAMTDDVGETDKLSVGPLLSRLLAAMRPEHRPPDGNNSGSGDGDVSMNGDLNDSQLANGAAGPDGEKSIPPAAYMPESASESWKKATHPKLEYNQVDERIKQELRHIGFLPFPDPSSAAGGANGANGTSGSGGVTNGTSGGANSANGAANGSGANGTANGTNGTGHGANGNDNTADPALTADYDGHFDDEIAARLRRLQAGLRDQMLVNGARKARLAELVKERMAYQEYQTILEDLDGQVNVAYLKRTRTMGKSKKGKRPGGAGGGAGGGAAAAAAAAAAAGTARPGIGDLTRTLMERRKRWMESIGTVFDDEKMQRVPRVTDPSSSIFQPDEMAALLKREKEVWDEEVDEE
ncbi:transcriptional regulator [Ophiostoma piceae UAMH 11346]|uniref:Transcriptional regulator n=1 Tax=Ophiostoma piceae (strain UAMH 11346) TaxID=1262450 RepID=S3BXN5_OPHP1|nr:transcriptional regulator [Ophiostoma piceae UAMH 11346]